jgi:hypothetical protein
MTKLEIQIASDVDRDTLVGEIWFADELIAEVSPGKDDMTISFYPPINGTEVPYKSLIGALEDIRKKLTK